MPKLLVHPLASEPPLLERPGGGPLEDLGAPHNSEVTAVVGLRSTSPPLEAGSFPGGLKMEDISNSYLEIFLLEVKLYL